MDKWLNQRCHYPVILRASRGPGPTPGNPASGGDGEGQGESWSSAQDDRHKEVEVLPSPFLVPSRWQCGQTEQAGHCGHAAE